MTSIRNTRFLFYLLNFTAYLSMSNIYNKDRLLFNRAAGHVHRNITQLHISRGKLDYRRMCNVMTGRPLVQTSSEISKGTNQIKLNVIDIYSSSIWEDRDKNLMEVLMSGQVSISHNATQNMASWDCIIRNITYVLHLFSELVVNKYTWYERRYSL